MMIEEYNDKRALKAMSTKREWPKVRTFEEEKRSKEAMHFDISQPRFIAIV
ncbi:hypothetical protein NC651_010198 [Populus alba x Populus x berolinensis]|nr:hypothetical protein NC651_010198 [Populus alba x Populus x berolinensis]